MPTNYIYIFIHIPSLSMIRWKTTCVRGRFECLVTKKLPSCNPSLRDAKSCSINVSCDSISGKWNSVECWHRSNRALLLPLPDLYCRQPKSWLLWSSFWSTSTTIALRWLVYNLVAVWALYAISRLGSYGGLKISVAESTTTRRRLCVDLTWAVPSVIVKDSTGCCCAFECENAAVAVDEGPRLFLNPFDQMMQRKNICSLVLSTSHHVRCLDFPWHVRAIHPVSAQN